MEQDTPANLPNFCQIWLQKIFFPLHHSQAENILPQAPPRIGLQGDLFEIPAKLAFTSAGAEEHI